ncbi:MAG: Asp-tRNA(Asn)/Glu-tRNA(Gln) amidotransferase subunit GatB, partial [Bacteroidia bacterium]
QKASSLRPEVRSQRIMNTVIGLEVHVQLNAERKVFATEGYRFGAEPNSCVSVIGMAHPGALPSVNRVCVEKVIRLGMALNCTINPISTFARKNYFYPDLPKGYQMSQDELPICINGYLDLDMPDGSVKRIGITQIHLEEDAGKLIHDQDPNGTLVDLNRAGVGLAEIVTEPDFRSAEEAATFLAEMRRLVRFLDAGDGDMEKGNLRCDANVSIRESEDAPLGTRAEIKNLNSFNFLDKAIQYEVLRQSEVLAKGEKVIQETRTFSPTTGRTSSMRSKEDAQDYRYFPEPDLPPLHLDESLLRSIREAMPELPWQRRKRYHSYGLQPAVIANLLDRLDWAGYFESLLQTNLSPKKASNWLTGPIAAWLNQQGLGADAFPITASKIAELESLTEQGKINAQSAKGPLFEALITTPETELTALVDTLGLGLSQDQDAIIAAVDALASSHPKEVERFRNGEKKLQGFLVGQLMRALRGKADPKLLNQLVQERLSN